MATVYRDYGTTQLATNTSIPVAPPNAFDTVRRRQVYQATHRGDGSRLPFMNRSFISFTYGGKPIEDFDLIAIIVNNRIDREAYAAFNDIVTTYDNLDGQFYWGTHYATNSMQFILSTDGIEQKTLDDFLYWFRAGEAKELILSEHPNRAIMARVATPPQISLLPFEENIQVNISGNYYPTKTTLYKGDITVEMVMDEPHWYAIDNILGKIVDVKVGDKMQKRYVDLWDDTSYDPPQEVDIFASQDALKILYEDGIPLGSMIDDNMLLGNGSYANVSSNVESWIWSLPEAQIKWINGVPTGEGARIDGEIEEVEYIERSLTGFGTEDYHWITTEDGTGLQFDANPEIVLDSRECIPGIYIGYIAGPIVDVNGDGIIVLAPRQQGNFFYAGTAPAPTILSFTIIPTFNTWGYCDAIANSIVNRDGSYNTITIESKNKQEFKFTTPNILTSYNKAVDILVLYYKPGYSIPEIKKRINNEIRHAGVREWVLAFLGDDEIIGEDVPMESIALRMTQFFMDDNKEITPMHFSFNSKTGTAIGNFTYRQAKEKIPLKIKEYEPNALNKIATIATEDPSLTWAQKYENLVTWGWDGYCGGVVPDDEHPNLYQQAVNNFLRTYMQHEESETTMPGIVVFSEELEEISNVVTSTEDVGDMVQSNNIVIRDRNYPNASGKVVKWMPTDPGREYSHAISHDLAVPLRKLQIQYRNMYL